MLCGMFCAFYSIFYYNVIIIIFFKFLIPPYLIPEGEILKTKQVDHRNVYSMVM